MELADLGIVLGIDSCSGRILPQSSQGPSTSFSENRSPFLAVKGMNEGSQPP